MSLVGWAVPSNRLSIILVSHWMLTSAKSRYIFLTRFPICGFQNVNHTVLASKSTFYCLQCNQRNSHFCQYTEFKTFPWSFTFNAVNTNYCKTLFFYGGFQIQNLSVKYHPDIDRWIINKKIVMSEDGYILDSSNLKFIKIRLESNKMNTTLGRVGMGVCSNIYQPPNERGEKLVLEVNLVDLLKIKDNHCHQLFWSFT